MVETTIRHCRCDRRTQDEATGTTRWSRAFGGWVMSDVPTRTRRMSWGTYEQVWLDQGIKTPPDHTGEPFIWEVCVYCGGDLPVRKEGEQRPHPTQADGDGPE